MSYDHVAVVGYHGKKTDVKVKSTDGHKFRASVKSFRGRGFNQVTRSTIERFVNKFNLSKEFECIIKTSTVSKARKLRRNWILAEDEKLVVKEVQPKSFGIIRESLVGSDAPDLLVLINIDKRVIYVHRMRDILDYVRKTTNVKITSRGVISLHLYFTLQKKGGNGRRSKYPKDDLRHGGNNIQIKMSCLPLTTEVSYITTLSY